MRVWIVIAIALTASCGGKKKESTGGDDTGKPAKKGHSGTPRPQTKLEVKLDGKPVDMVAAYARLNPDHQIEYTLSNKPLGCDEITGDIRSIDDDEVTFGFTTSQQLQPDGSLKAMIVSRYFEGMTEQKSTPTTQTGDGKNGVETSVDVDFEIKSAGKEPRTLTAKGTVVAQGCMAKRLPPAMMSSEQPVKITIAGKTFNTGNALIEPGDWTTLVLTSGTETCAHGPSDRAGEVVVRFTWFKKDDPHVSQISLGGTMLPNVSDQTFDKDAVTITPAPPVKITQTKIQVNATINGYPVEIHGNFVADICKK